MNNCLPSLIIADDHAVFRELLRTHFENKGYLVLGDVSNGLELVAKVGKLKPDVVLLDLDMPLVDGYEAARIISSEMEDVRIIVLTAVEDLQLLETLRLYTHGYIKKVASLKTIEEAIVSVSKGEKYFLGVDNGQKVVGFKKSNIANINVNGEVKCLTERENEIIKYLLNGLANDEIATRLCVSINTVKYHLKNIYRKFNAVSRRELMNKIIG